MGAGFAGWAWLQHGQPDWWPLSFVHFPDIPTLFP
jgi:hypothetical protein